MLFFLINDGFCRKSFEVSTKKKLDTKFNKTESLEVFETIKKEYNSSPVTFGSSSGKKEALLELLIITAGQIATEYKDCDVVLNKGVPEIKKVKSS